MSILKDLVPPIELCRKIPAGEFAGSPFVWVEEWAYDEIDGEKVECFIYLELSSGYMVVNPKPTKEVAEEIFNTTGKRPVRAITPAPTLEEILQELVNLSVYRLNVCKSWGEWHIDCYDDERLIEKDSVKNIATAALKLWLNLKGIEDGE
jgi:hypothetical protein